MKTSYYSSPLIHDGKFFLVPISNKKPRAFDDCLSEIVPDWDTIVDPYKKGLIDQEEYRKRYIKQLNHSKRTILFWLQLIENRASKHDKEIIFLCFEKSGDFCHRHILAEWIEEQTGETVEELKAPEFKEPTLW